MGFSSVYTVLPEHVINHFGGIPSLNIAMTSVQAEPLRHLGELV